MKIPDMTKRFVCRRCQRETGHRPIANGQIEGSKNKLEHNEYSSKMFRVFQCKDCGVTTYCIDTKLHPDSIMDDPYIQDTKYYPPLPFRIKPDWYPSLEDEYKNIFDEIYHALDNSLFSLASMGIRTALDKLIRRKIGDVGGFKDKVCKLVTDKIIGETEKKMLLAAIDAGSASAHRGYRPSIALIGHMMDILETIFYKLIVEPEKTKELEKKASELANSTPKRNS